MRRVLPALALLLTASAPAQWGGPAQVELATVVREEVAPALTLTGTAVAYRSSALAASREGLVVERRVYFGVSYEEGDVLLRLESTLETAARDAAAARAAAARARHQELVTGPRTEDVAVARAELARARAALTEAEANRRRQQDLFDQRATTHNELDAAIRAADVAKAEVAAARARLDLLEAGTRKEQLAAAAAELRQAEAELARAQEELDDMTVRAPFPGTADAVLVEVGSWVERGGKITDLVDRSILDVVVLVPEGVIRQVPLMEPARCVFRRLEPPVVVTSGKVVSIGPRATEGGKTFPIVVRFENPDDALRPGMSVDVDVPVGAPAPRLLVPKDAILRRQGSPPSVFVAEEGKAVRKEVELGIQVGGRVEVTSGIEEGARVVIRGNERLQPGAQLALGGSKGEAAQRDGATP